MSGQFAADDRGTLGQCLELGEGEIAPLGCCP
jgi:hypothetical protein